MTTTPQPMRLHEIKQAAEQVASTERVRYADVREEPKFRPLGPKDTRVDRYVQTEPPELDFIFNDVMPLGIVGALIGTGGVSKSFFQIAECISAATGQTVLEKLTPPRPLRVLALFAEDSEQELHRRVHRTVKAVFPYLDAETQALLFENLHMTSVMGLANPLMRLNANNPERTESFDWLKATIEAHGDLDLVILDPKSRFYGLDENNNDHNTAWVSCLEEIVRERNLTIQFSHHVSKASNGALNQASARGGSALVDACRWVGNLRTMDEATANRFGIGNHKRYVEFDISKNNYGPGLSQPVYFHRGEHGVLAPANLEFQALSERANLICALLSAEAQEGRSYTKQELVYRPVGKKLRNDMPCNRDDLERALDYAIREGWITQVSGSTADAVGRPKVILSVERMPL